MRNVVLRPDRIPQPYISNPLQLRLALPICEEQVLNPLVICMHQRNWYIGQKVENARYATPPV